MLENYILYLEYITIKLQKFFAEQKDYIFCHKGCGKCCKKAQFPYTEIEFELIKYGYFLLSEDEKKLVSSKIKNILEDKKRHNENNLEEKFRYECPFLIDNTCSVYNFRGLVCRAFGLMSFIPNSDDKPKVPFCAYEGLNYSNVLDANKNNIPPENFEKTGIKIEPKAYNVDYTALTDDKIAEGFGFKFGNKKPLIDWLEQINI